MPESEDPKKVSNNDLRNSQFGGGFINADTVNAQRIGGDIWNFFFGQQLAPVGNPARPENQRLLLAQVKHEVEARLDQSLHNTVLINLGKELQPQQVKRPWDAEIKIGLKPPEPLPENTSIVDVFDSSAIAGKLLILGAPGSGKTTTMLELAQALVTRAEEDPSYPIPVLFNLSSWKSDHQHITEWLVVELNSKYGVSKKLAKEWVESRQLLPLLDGLDEVMLTLEEPCVRAINQLLQSNCRPQYLVVCSRREQYASYETRLQLSGAVLLQTLMDEQIQKYLADVNRVDFWQVLQQDAALLELVRIPLLLSITLLSYKDLSLAQRRQLTSTEKLLELMLDAYVRQMLSREINSLAYLKRQPPTTKQTVYWLSQLAKQLQQTSQTEFLIESLQPFYITSRHGIFTYLWIDWLLNFIDKSSIFYGLAGKLSKKFGFTSKKGLVCRLIRNLTPSLLVDFMELMEFLVRYLNRQPTQRLRERFTELLQTEMTFRELIDEIKVFDVMRWSLNIRKIISPLAVWTACGASIGLFVEKYFLINSGFIFGIFFGFLYGLQSGLYRSIDVTLSVSDVKVRKLPNYGIRKLIINSLVFYLVFKLTFCLLFGLITGLLMIVLNVKNGFILGLGGGLFLGLFSFFHQLVFMEGGNKAAIQHFFLRLILYSEGCIPWNYARFLDYCTERMLLQRVGGRYRFIHKLLQDHFAQMPLK